MKKENESIETQKIGPELPIVTATSKKSKRARDETSHVEKCIQKLKRRKQPQKWIFWKIKYTQYFKVLRTFVKVINAYI